MTFRILMLNECRDVSDYEFRKVIKAIQTQLTRDFYPYWGIDAELIVVKDKSTPLASRASGIIYLRDKAPGDGYLGYHDTEESNGMPYGYVFQDVVEKMGEQWSVTMSHEILELVLNRHCNYYAKGPHPTKPGRDVLFWMEACDAVQDQTYSINGVEVSDFVTPHYFTVHEEDGIPNNFCHKRPVPSFGLTEGGYVGFWDPKTGEEQTINGSDKALQRHSAKALMGEVRRSSRK